jgi:hypothetical protein
LDVARSCLLALFALGCLALPSHAAEAGASKARVKHGVNVEVKRGTLRITGNRKANSVTLRLKRRARGILEVDVGRAGRAEFRFRRRAFRRIVVNGGRGSDSLGISEQNGAFTNSERTTLVGGRGNDALVLTGTRGADSIALSASRRRVRIARGSGRAAAAAGRALTASVEDVSITPLGGADTIAFGDLSGAGVDSLLLQLGSRRGGDRRADTVSASATAGPDALTAMGSGASLHISGLPWVVTVANLEPDRDRFTLNGAGGVDTLHLSGTGGVDPIGIEPNGGLLHTAVGGAQLDSDDIEILRVNALGGSDVATLRDLAGTDVSQVTLDLGSAAGGPADGTVDVVNVNGGDGGDNLAVSGGASGIAVSGLTALTSIEAPDAADALFVNGLGGADAINASGLAANGAVLSLRGGPDVDTLTGSPGDDAFAWEPGDGSDVLDGGNGLDSLAMGGSDDAEAFSLSVAAGHTLLTRNLDGVSIDTDAVESADFNPRGGADSIAVPNLTGAELTKVGVNLASGDGLLDNVIVDGRNPDLVNGIDGIDHITVTGAGSTATVGGLAVQTTVTGADPATDRLTIRALGATDTIDASMLQANVISASLEGGQGEDVLLGSPDDDTFVWRPGDSNDTLEGQAGSDTLLFNGASVAENIDISANGGRVSFFRNVGNVLVDCNDVEIANFIALGGADNVVINNMAGTDLSQVNVALAGSNGGGDAAVDNVTLAGTGSADSVSIAGGPGTLAATGSFTGLSITGGEAGADRLTFNAGIGGDTVDASAVGAGAMLLTLNGEAGNDTLTGGAGVDTINGGPEDDLIHGGPSIDILNGGGQAGDQVFED